MTKEEATQLGIASRNARDYFEIIGAENTQIDPAKRAAQVERYERARADMHEAMNRHHAALEQLK
jgi:hypothetical protein